MIEKIFTISVDEEKNNILSDEYEMIYEINYKLFLVEMGQLNQGSNKE